MFRDPSREVMSGQHWTHGIFEHLQFIDKEDSERYHRINSASESHPTYLFENPAEILFLISSYISCVVPITSSFISPLID